MNIKSHLVNKRREVLPSTDKPTVFSEQVHIVSGRKLLSNRGFPFFPKPAPHPSPPRSPPPEQLPKQNPKPAPAPFQPKPPPAPVFSAIFSHITAAQQQQQQQHQTQKPAPPAQPKPSPNNPAPGPAAAPAPTTGPTSSGPSVNNDKTSPSSKSGPVANPATGSAGSGSGTRSPDSVPPSSYIPVQTLGPSSNDNGTTSSSATQLSAQPSTLSGGAIAGIVIGTLLFVGLVAFALYRALIFKKKRQGKEEDNFERDSTQMSHLGAPTAFANYPSTVSMIHSQEPEHEQSPFHDSNTLTFPVPPPIRTLNSSRVALVGHGGSSSGGGHGAASSYGGNGTRSSFSSHHPAVSFSTGRATEGDAGGRLEDPPPPLPTKVGAATSTDENHSDDVVYMNPFHADDAESTEGHSPDTGETLRLKSSDSSRYRTVGSGRRRTKSAVSSVDRSSSVVDPFHADDALSARVIEGERVTLHLSGADATRYKEMSLARSMTIANHNANNNQQHSNFSSLPPE